MPRRPALKRSGYSVFLLPCGYPTVSVSYRKVKLELVYHISSRIPILPRQKNLFFIGSPFPPQMRRNFYFFLAWPELLWYNVGYNAPNPGKI